MTDSLPRSGVAPMSGPMKLSDGAASSPGLAFNSSQGTGLFKTTNGIGVAVNGVQVGEFTANGLSRLIGELIPWTGSSVPAGYVFAFGQTLSRTTYASLWAFAQAEISAGNLFYNNGNGTTTFGIGDLRGRSLAGIDTMGGTDAGRLVGSNVNNRGAVGGSGGEAAHTLTVPEMPNHGHSVTDPGHTHDQDAISFGTPGLVSGGSGNAFGHISQPTARATTNITVNSTGGGAAHGIVQPTILCNYALYAGA